MEPPTAAIDLALADAKRKPAVTREKRLIRLRSEVQALLSNTSGANNIAIGTAALFSNTTGFSNTASGRDSLKSNTTGYINTATGRDSLRSNTTGSSNTATGSSALYSTTTGTDNTGSGRDVLTGNSTGSSNTAIGARALSFNSMGNGNIALGFSAGDTLTTGNNNIDIGNKGVAAESGKIRIGTTGTHTDTFLAGVIHGDGTGLTGLTGASFSAGSITNVQLANNAVQAGNIATDAVQSANIASGAVGTSDLADGAVTNPKLASNAVQSANIANGAVGTTELAAGAVTTSKLNLTGNVGIGTATPGFPLSFGDNLVDKISLFGQSGNSYGFGIQSSLLQIHTDTMGQDIAFGHGNSATMIETMRITGSGSVGIGTTNPTKAKVEIIGVAGSYRTGGPSYTYNAAGVANLHLNPFTSTNYSLYASNEIAAFNFLAFSDERIKHIDGYSDAGRDLTTLLGIKVTDYTYIDTVAKGTGKYKKVIAQQVEKVYPQAVNHSTDVVPDIYQKAEVKDGWVNLATNLKKGERVRLIGATKEGIHQVLEVGRDKFRTDFAADDHGIFVYGREVKDFCSVDYEAIAMLNVSATQELARKVEVRDEQIASLISKLAALETRDQDREARLARLESSSKNSLDRTTTVSLQSH